MILTTSANTYLKEYLLSLIDKVRVYSTNFSPTDPPDTYIEKTYDGYAIVNYNEIQNIKSIVFFYDNTPLLYINNLSLTPSPELIIKLVS